uniref:Phosphoribosylglycinamide formyltransferase n=1 Tax=Nakaseomyces delphensis TaxID=51657 RepID=A7WPJ4_NAKDE|nr:phosphoribosyl-glycinamide transformylase [Nakaseomyces delphensis]
MTKRVTVLISGSGSNLQALLDAEREGRLGDISVTYVVSSSKNAYGLVRAERAGVPTMVHSLYKYSKGIPKEDVEARRQARAQFEADLATVVAGTEPDLVVCAGWLLILGPAFLTRLRTPILNLHPALPGQFDGTTHAIEMAWNKCQRENKPLIAGCMVHYVIEAVDKGAPLVVKELELIPGEETLEEYEQRVHRAEHIAIVEATIRALQ